MTEQKPGFTKRIVARVRRLPAAVLVAIGAGVVAIAVAGGLQLYRTYDYIQHDNDFCLSCHLMVDPFERFARSAHRGLGCKACHQPTLVTRSTMALTQVLENPDSLEAHAEVPNRVCVECHVEGDPIAWRNIASSAGHRVHLESGDPSIAELECVQCHSSSVHEFTATDETCGQSGCHEDQRIQLGEMGALTIHCATCHDFNQQVASAAADSAQLALQPQREECLSCHAMRERLADFPLAGDDPHGGACGACHNPHEQAQPADAFATCAGCHSQADTLTPFHRGLDAGVLETCSRCHGAHTFHADGSDCQACHTEAGGTTTVSRAPARALRLLAALVLPARAAAQQPEPDVPADFDHARHVQVECLACHDVESTHGSVTVSGLRECRACHHSGPVVQRCERCHQPAEYASQRFQATRPFTPTVGRAADRSFPFDHRAHTDVACASCHSRSPDLSAARIDCAFCHEQHHEPANDCMACHRTPRQGAHTRASHLTCAGSGCHSSPPVNAAQRTRTLCLGCHQDMTDHQPGRRCEACHALPDALQTEAGS